MSDELGFIAPPIQWPGGTPGGLFRPVPIVCVRIAGTGVVVAKVYVFGRATIRAVISLLDHVTV
jgi:hypothetical protein